jgi:predicted Fe-Mo cluster-binding NifX family protein
MKVSVPSIGKDGMDDTVSQHFGRAPAYIVFDTEAGNYSVVPNTSDHNGGVGLPVDLLAKAGVNVMLCGGIGKGAAAMCQRSGIDVFIGASGTVRDAINAWKSGALSKATQDGNCDSHSHSSHCQGGCHGHIAVK